MRHQCNALHVLLSIFYFDSTIHTYDNVLKALNINQIFITIRAICLFFQYLKKKKRNRNHPEKNLLLREPTKCIQRHYAYLLIIKLFLYQFYLSSPCYTAYDLIALEIDRYRSKYIVLVDNVQFAYILYTPKCSRSIFKCKQIVTRMTSVWSKHLSIDWWLLICSSILSNPSYSCGNMSMLFYLIDHRDSSRWKGVFIKCLCFLS